MGSCFSKDSDKGSAFTSVMLDLGKIIFSGSQPLSANRSMVLQRAVSCSPGLVKFCSKHEV